MPRRSACAAGKPTLCDAALKSGHLLLWCLRWPASEQGPPLCPNTHVHPRKRMCTVLPPSRLPAPPQNPHTNPRHRRYLQVALWRAVHVPPRPGDHHGRCGGPLRSGCAGHGARGPPLVAGDWEVGGGLGLGLGLGWGPCALRFYLLGVQRSRYARAPRGHFKLLSIPIPRFCPVQVWVTHTRPPPDTPLCHI